MASDARTRRCNTVCRMDEQAPIVATKSDAWGVAFIYAVVVVGLGSLFIGDFPGIDFLRLAAGMLSVQLLFRLVFEPGTMRRRRSSEGLFDRWLRTNREASVLIRTGRPAE
jgi:hypothetical protein